MAMNGPFCSVPPVGTMAVVLPAAIASRTSVQVRSSRNTLDDPGSDGALCICPITTVVAHTRAAKPTPAVTRMRPPGR
jgi:hypothetical protein